MELIRTSRELRVDFFRGCALWWIFVDHMPGNWLAEVSLHNFALCDAAEVFVLLAGYGSSRAYAIAMDRMGWLYGAADAVRRAWTLYIAHIFLFVVVTAQVAYSATALDRTLYLDEIHLDVISDAPYRALLEALILRFQPSFLNILPLYVVLLTMFAAVMPLLHRPRILAILCFSIYTLARVFDWNFPSWIGEGWYFNPFTWQFLFMMGAIMAYAPPRTPRRPAILDGLAILIVAAGLLVVWWVWRQPEVIAALPLRASPVLLSVDKTGLHPFRLLSIAALTWLVVRFVPAKAGWLRSRWAAPLVLMGQHSLPVFCCGIFLSFLGRLAMEWNDRALMQTAVNLAGAAALVGVGALAAWYREKGRPPQRPAAPAQAASRAKPG